MIRIMRFDNKWRIEIANEVLQFEDSKTFEKALKDLLTIKKEFEVDKK